ncbi:MAG: S4 domain-containing protein [Gammaproteobacteria bacterium SHHR-1]|uniref:RNA-binding S4 domain-containing protein n=1 Tax=Magnetovirga frankeli TaxID=947516 RepID=UPI00129367CF|nr:RNA-binding S4 domain-containing protein [gamma proteobacterium SS-5]
MRLDKWLWAARFYKTRQLAVEAINGGHVHLNGQRSKPGKEVQLGSRLQISKAGLHWDIRVEQLPKQRRPAAEAALSYSEDEASQASRQARREELRAERQALPAQAQGKPNKRDRRLIHRFKQVQ